MPNWCNNILIVKGNKSEVKKLINSTKGKEDYEEKEYPLFFDTISPTPKELLDSSAMKNGKIRKANQKKYKASNWYEWRIKNWGTKWNPNFVEVKYEDDNKTVFIFDTAWDPPIPIISKLAKQFPNLFFELRYIEPSMGFAGVFEIHNNNKSERYYNDTNDEYNDFLIEFGYDDILKDIEEKIINNK